MRTRKLAWITSTVIIAALIADQALKIWVKTHFFYGEEVEILPWFRLMFIENNGMAFGWELGSKYFLTAFRIIFSIVFIYYLVRLCRTGDKPAGYVVCIALITAGAIGNVIDCIAYGRLFNDPMAPQVAQMLPADGGYAEWFNGKVVDMLYFPLCEWDWPQWMPGVGGKHFLFFQPVFNIADACLSVSVITLLLFYSKHLASGSKEQEGEKAEDADGINKAEKENKPGE